MARSRICMLLALSLLLSLFGGCGGEPVEETMAPTEPAVETTVSLLPPDGDPNDVTCKGTYTLSGDPDAVVARIGEAELTNGQLSAWYWAEVGAYRTSQELPKPDFSQPLDIQPCPIDSSVNSWQQFFLRRALNTWHSAQALVLQGEAEGLPLEESYGPNEKWHEENLQDIPATQFLYGYEKSFRPNTMHSAWLEEIPTMLETLAQEKGYGSAREMAEQAFGTTLEDLEAFVSLYNRGYMYFTNLTYYVEVSDEELEAWFAEREEQYAKAGITRESGVSVDIRHILLIPKTLSAEKSDTGEADEVTVAEDGTVTASEARWEACEKKAKSLVKDWKKEYRHSGGTFGNMAFQESADTATALDGGAYRGLTQGMLIEPLDEWCFGEGRKAGDTTILRSPYGVHILYFLESRSIWQEKAEEDILAERQTDLLGAARTAYPIAVEYGAITLGEGEGKVSQDAVLYPDVAHERYPEIPIYLQADYPGVMYGGYLLRTNGCGITSLAMLATYMADDELTPPEMCARYGRYSHSNGTDGMIFLLEPGNLGFYCREKTYDTRVAHKALEEGQIVVSVQHKGYWTRGGHYIVLEKLNDDGTIQVRDSNIFNYGKLKDHKKDSHSWGSITANGSGYWIFEDKVVRIPGCWRCGDPETVTGSPLLAEYTCHKCGPAQLRRGTYLTGCAGAE